MRLTITNCSFVILDFTLCIINHNVTLWHPQACRFLSVCSHDIVLNTSVCVLCCRSIVCHDTVLNTSVPRCKSMTGRQNQDRLRLSTNHRRSSRDRSRPVLDCKATLYVCFAVGVLYAMILCWTHHVCVLCCRSIVCHDIVLNTSVCVLCCRSVVCHDIVLNTSCMCALL